MLLVLQSLFGFVFFFALAWLLSERRAQVSWRTVGGAIALQVMLALLLFNFPFFKQVSLALNGALAGLQSATNAGTSLLFGYVGGGELPFAVLEGKSAYVLAAQALPLVVVISALSSLLYYWRVVPLLVRGISWLLSRSIGVGGALGVSTAANVFLGPVESPLFIRPYLARMSRGELFAVMTGGMAGIAGTVMALYAVILQATVPDALGHILICGFISAPAALAFAALMVPHEGPLTDGEASTETPASSSMDAVTQGAIGGMQILINIVAMILVLTALVAIVNQLLQFLPSPGAAPLTLQSMLGWLMAPLVWLTGIPWSEATTAGALMGTKTILNEFLAYLDMAALGADQLSDRSRLIMTYSLCGFANFASLGILMGGLGTLCPERRAEIAELGARCLVSGTLATLSCGALVGAMSLSG